MTPYRIKILLEYYSCPDPEFTATYCLMDELGMLSADGLIEPAMKAGSYKITAKGKFWIEYVLNTPYPKTKFVIPERSEG